MEEELKTKGEDNWHGDIGGEFKNKIGSRECGITLVPSLM